MVALFWFEHPGYTVTFHTCLYVYMYIYLLGMGQYHFFTSDTDTDTAAFRIGRYRSDTDPILFVTLKVVNNTWM